MNPEIVKGQIRSIIIALGGLAGGYFLSPSQDASLAPVFGAFATMAAGFIWSAVTHRHDNAVAVVAAMAKDKDSPVRGVILEPTVAGRVLTESIAATSPGAVAPAGTVDADKISSRYVKN